MNILLVGYDLNRSGQQYEDVWAYLKGQVKWWHHLDSTWIVKTPLTPVELRNGMKAHGIDSNDELFVVDITGQSAAWSGFNDKGSAWLKENL